MFIHEIVAFKRQVEWKDYTGWIFLYLDKNSRSNRQNVSLFPTGPSQQYNGIPFDKMVFDNLKAEVWAGNTFLVLPGLQRNSMVGHDSNSNSCCTTSTITPSPLPQVAPDPAKPTTVPGRPTSVSVEVYDAQSLKVVFSPPADDGGDTGMA